jgi:spore germination cell wall hydrolase CwlJ-like protein
VETAALTALFVGALTVWREARNQSAEGKLAVAYTIVERASRPGWWNKGKAGSVVAVVAMPWQYSSITDPKDPQLRFFPAEADAEWDACVTAMRDALAGSKPNPVPGADSYYATSMAQPPGWATEQRFKGQVGDHRFYKLL